MQSEQSNQSSGIKEKTKILIFIEHFLPGYKSGGPQKSIVNILKYLNQDFDFFVVCRNRDFGDTNAYPNIPLFEWVRLDGFRVLYYDEFNLPKLAQSISFIKSNDIVLLNSFFSIQTYIFFVLKLFYKVGTRKILLAPRGEFFLSALNMKKFKKSLFITLVRGLGVLKQIKWMATDEAEKIAITDIFNTADIGIASDIPQGDFDRKLQFVQKSKNYLKIASLSRIAPIKNLEVALELIGRISPDVIIEFDIYGTLEDKNYWEKCQKMIAKLEGNVHVSYKGPLLPHQVGETLEGYHVFLFPTQSENFGHVIFEALSAGLITLISDQTPWKNLEAFDAGWELPLDNPAAFVEKLERLAAMSQEKIDQMRQGAKHYAKNAFETQNFVGQTRDLFLSMTSNNRKEKKE